MAHLVFKFIAAGLIRWIVEWRTEEPRIMLGWKEYCKRVALTGMCMPGERGWGGGVQGEECLDVGGISWVEAELSKFPKQDYTKKKVEQLRLCKAGLFLLW